MTPSWISLCLYHQFLSLRNRVRLNTEGGRILWIRDKNLKKKVFQLKRTVDDVNVCDWRSVRETGDWIHTIVGDLNFTCRCDHKVWVFWQLCGCFDSCVGVLTVVWVFWQLCGCFDSCVGVLTVMWVFWQLCGCFYSCVGVLVICVLLFTVFCIVCTVFCIVSFMYIFSYLFVCTSLRTNATEWQLNCSK